MSMYRLLFYLLIRFRFRFGTAAIFFHCVRLESVFVLVTKEKIGRHPMPPTSDGAMDIRATHEAMFDVSRRGKPELVLSTRVACQH